MMHDAKVILDFVSKCRNYFMSIGFALISDNLGIRLAGVVCTQWVWYENEIQFRLYFAIKSLTLLQ